MKTDLLDRLNNGKHKTQHRALLSLDKEITQAMIPDKSTYSKTDYSYKLDIVEEGKRKPSLTQVKALTVDNTYIVDVIFYTRNNPNHVDEATNKLLNHIKPDFTDILCDR